MFEELLDIPEGAGQFEALEALSSLREEVAAAKACCAQKEEELQHLREQTAELVAAQLAEAGADEDYVQAAKAMWLQAPHSVSQAIGIEVLKGANPYKTSTSDDLVEAERGCNQYKHKPGCPEADGSEEENSGGSWAERWRAKSDEEKLGAYEAGLKRAEEEAKKTGSFDAFERVKIYRKRVASYRKKIARSVQEQNPGHDTVKSAHEPSIEDLLVGDLVQAAGCNQYKHKPGCPEAEGANDYEAEIEKTRKKLESANDDKHKKQKVLNDLVKEKEMYNRWAFEKQREGWSLEKINEDFDRQMAKVMPKIEQAEKEFNDAVKEWQDIGAELSRLKYEAEKSKKAKDKEAEIEYTLKNKDIIRKNYEKIQQEKFDIEEEFMRYSNLIKKHGPYEMLDEEEAKFVNELKEKRKKWFEKLKVADRRLDAEIQKLRDTGLWGNL